MNLTHQVYRLQLVNPFGISRSTRSHNDMLLIRIDEGWGEACPSAYYGETLDSLIGAFQKAADMDLPPLEYVEDVADSLAEAVPGNQSAKAAIDIALHDRLSKRLGLPLYKLFGRAPRPQRITSFTIGIDSTDVMLRKVDDARAYRILKIKLGKDVKHDVDVMRRIREAVGDKTLRVDANAGWSLDDARAVLPVMADLGVEFVEQPLRKGAIDDLRILRKTSPLPIFVDEDSVTSADLPGLVGAVDGINIKLMKSGGIVEARRMIATARALGFKIMLGCMIETSVAIAAAAHLSGFADYLDLDGNILTSNDPFEGVVCDPDGTLHLSEEPGLGVRVRSEYATALGITG